MEQVIDAVVEQLNILAEANYDDGGFRDQIDLADTVWWGNPGILADQQYPFIYVEPVTTGPESETTGNNTVTETVRIALLADPRTLYDESEVVEATASREVVRTMENIRKHFKKTSLRQPNGLCDGSTKVVVSLTEYAQQLRGTLYSTGAAITLLVDVREPKVQ